MTQTSAATTATGLNNTTSIQQAFGATAIVSWNDAVANHGPRLHVTPGV